MKCFKGGKYGVKNNENIASDLTAPALFWILCANPLNTHLPPNEADSTITHILQMREPGTTQFRVLPEEARS